MARIVILVRDETAGRSSALPSIVRSLGYDVTLETVGELIPGSRLPGSPVSIALVDLDVARGLHRDDPGCLEISGTPLMAVASNLQELDVDLAAAEGIAGLVFEDSLATSLPQLIGPPGASIADIDRIKQELRVARRLSIVGRLAGGVAHDFNNLLTAILTYTDFLLEDLADEPDLCADMEEIDRAARRAADLTRQLLLFARRRFVRPELLNLNEVTDTLEKLLGRVANEEREFTIERGTVGLVDLDPILVDQLIFWMVLSGHDLAPARAALKLSTRDDSLDGEMYVRLSVSFGSGSADEAAAFDRGRGASSENLSPLAHLDWLVADQGWKLATGVVAGQGSRIDVWVPHAVESPPALGRSVEGSETIAVIEDEPAMLTLVTRILTSNGYTVVTATDGAEGLELIANYANKIDLLVTDVVMPEHSGVEMAAALAEVDPTVPVLYISGYADEILEGQGYVSERSELLPKPFSRAELMKAVVGRLELVRTRP